MKKTTTLLLAIFCVIHLSTPIAEAGGKRGFLKSGIGYKFHSTWPDFRLATKQNFVAGDDEIIWLGSFRLFAASHTAALRADWITPAGEVFRSVDFVPVQGNMRYAFTKLLRVFWVCSG